MPHTTSRDDNFVPPRVRRALEGHFQPGREADLTKEPFPHKVYAPGTGKMHYALNPEEHIERTSQYHGSSDIGFGAYTSKDVWKNKEHEVTKPANSGYHGAGIYDDLMSGNPIRNPVRVIIDPNLFGGYPTAGHKMVQWQGHHRVMGAALKQKALREAGDPNWKQPVPYDIHFSLAEGAAADRNVHSIHSYSHGAGTYDSGERWDDDDYGDGTY